MTEFCIYIIDNSRCSNFRKFKILDFIRYDLERKIVREAKIEIQVSLTETV